MQPSLAVVATTFTAIAVAFISRIAISQGALSVAGLLWLIDTERRHAWRRTLLPDYLYPLSLYVLLSAAASAFSYDPMRSVTRLKEMLLFGSAILLLNQLDSRLKVTALTAILSTSGVVLSVWGIGQYLTWPTNIESRICGPLSHYMTYSGLVLLLATTALSYAVFGKKLSHRLLHGGATAVMLVALLLTRTRSAWLGCAAAILLLVVLRVPRLLLLAPPVIVLLLCLAPQPVFNRIMSIVNRKNDTNIARYYLWQGGIRMIADHPFLGVGPKMAKAVYMGTCVESRPSVPYRDPRTPTESDAHLHNNVLQVAAERGLPALGAWIAIFVAMGLYALGRWRIDPSCPAVTAAVLALTAFHVSGLFEYNFGDSEVILLLLVVTTLPYAEERLATPAAAA